MSDDILNKVGNYYSEKIVNNGASSEGVDWNSKASHYLRFEQLTKNFLMNEDTTILDYGCGYGALIDFFKEKNTNFKKYVGFDISEEMIQKARELFKDHSVSFLYNQNELEDKKFDYVVANGIFNVRLDEKDDVWLAYILKTLDHMNSISEKGFSFNILTKYSDKEYLKDYLYYADPLFLFDHCKIKYSNYVSLLHDYPLYEFSIIVK